jgi:UDP-2,3-diacylglucosamine hydrolase
MSSPKQYPVTPHTNLQAPSHWRCVEFISDLHLHAQDADTFMAWRGYMAQTPADAVFILGDWFEVWVGDDALQGLPASQHLGTMSFEERCARVCRSSAEQRAIYVMHGNRDFLLGNSFLRACNAQLLADPTVLEFAGQRLLLTHGDALCLADTEYQAFRAQVRSPAWQKAFLAKPIEERQHIARGLRDGSEARKQQSSANRAGYADVDTQAARELMAAHACQTMIHGHTHQPATHDLGGGRCRIVLSDWDMRAGAPRAQVLRFMAGQSQPERVDLHTP